MTDLFDLFYSCSSVCTDTRNIFPDSLFIALKGSNFNGNEFAEEAITKGAKFAIVDEKNFANSKQIYYVENSLIFLQNLALYHRRKFNIPVIGITGTNGKTSTKELCAAVLKQKFNVLFTEGNLNNHIGVPLTILKLTKKHDLAIIEMGANKKGDIKELAEIAEPTHGIITNIGQAHLEGFGSISKILHTKKELYDFLEINKGVIFINAEDPILVSITPKNTALIKYGRKAEGSNIKGEIIEIKPEIYFNLETSGHIEKIKSNLIGEYNFTNMLASASIGDYFGISTADIKIGIESYVPKNNRSQIKRTNNNVLILDAYNANPTSVNVAIDSFIQMTHESKFFILGDMLELGTESITFHQSIVDKCISNNLEGIFIGKNYKNCSNNTNSFYFFEQKDEASIYLKKVKLQGRLILLKGSRGIGLESLEILL